MTKRAIAISCLAVLMLSSCSSPKRDDAPNADLFSSIVNAPELSVLPQDAMVVDTGQLRPCQAGSRSDRWGERTVLFTTQHSFEEVSQFYRMQFERLGWTLMPGAFGPRALLFKNTDGSKPYQLRVSQLAEQSDRYVLIAEVPPSSRC